MVLPFPYRPYIAIIGDIKGSKHSRDRQAVQARLTKALDSINQAHEKELASRFMITLGDEFQGLLKDGSAAAAIIDCIEREMYPVRIRFGVGVGEITTDIRFDMPLGADGPAYHQARTMIEELKASEKKKMESRVNVKIGIREHAEVSDLLNAVFSLLTALKEGWTARRVEIVNAYLNCGGTQEEAARVLGINQSNVQKALASAHFYAYQKALESVARVLAGIGEERDV